MEDDAVNVGIAPSLLRFARANWFDLGTIVFV
jgi:hypothetical protein